MDHERSVAAHELTALAEPELAPLPGVIPPRRAAPAGSVTPAAALAISSFYRGVQILATSLSQLTIDQYRGSTPIAPSQLAIKPDPQQEAAHLWQETGVSLCTTGNAYWRHRMLGDRVIGVQLLHPSEVYMAVDPDTLDTIYSWRGQSIPAARMSHLKLLRTGPGMLGLGPVQAAQIELRGAIEARDYGSKWLTESDVPTGVLSSDQVLTKEQADTYRSIWRGDGDTSPAGHRVRVLGQGLRYSPILLKPADVQFIETRQFNKTEIATLLGVPASLLLARVDGASLTYSNVEQEWINYTRFTLMAYLREMEVALSALLPLGNTVRFNVDGLLRTDLKTRYEAHQIALTAGFLDDDEVRALEGRAPFTAAQRAARSSTPTPTPEPVEAPAA
jgi:HK97 family phage portal protein